MLLSLLLGNVYDDDDNDDDDGDGDDDDDDDGDDGDDDTFSICSSAQIETLG